ncbi:hypothetical protein Q4551_08995 [Oceanobacter sp. 5_MG-2023]|uniref:hypothetical protein n=1 Tax=Oceanobacter sp. 5_MG-2023 TaxID=3062645 RepID=UPI0026E3DB41|nr:hypothetical protein [Oceanobacter sp. 5_MG-2023]MDO6682425.1 hypothetical protein [Oceanobacter sp. 5_MG-2023]
MMNKKDQMPNEFQFISVDDLTLDLENPRLPDSLVSIERNEKRIINWMLEDASLIELMAAISENDFFVGEALLVVVENGKNVVIEGNRRLASVKVLNNFKIAEIHQRRVKEVVDTAKYIPSEIPCIFFNDRTKIEQYLGYRHVTGVKTWGVLAKAKYLKKLAGDQAGEPLSEVARDLARKIGSRSDYVKNLLAAYAVYEEIRDRNFFHIRNLDETTIHFNYFVDSIRRENIRKFINVDTNSVRPTLNISIKNLNILTAWFFEKNEFNRTMVKGDSKSLATLDDILGDENAKEVILDTNSLEEASGYINQTSVTFSSDLKTSLNILERAHSYIHKIERHNNDDLSTLKDLFNLCKTMRDSIKAKENDEEF